MNNLIFKIQKWYFKRKLLRMTKKELMVRYYNVQWDKVLCDLCKQKILDGVPI